MELPSAQLPWPTFLKLLAHELRWKILVLLTRSDYCGLEIVQRLKKPQNLISYHLRLLATHQLVSEHRSAADGRDMYYSLNLDLLCEQYAAAATALHPALGNFTVDSQDILARRIQVNPPLRVLFLCTENSARSQMAEGLLRYLAGNSIDVCSAGSQPSEVHPYAIQILAQMGIDISHATSKQLDTFRDQTFDVVITVCDRMKECCPTFPGDSEPIHWSLPDPVALEGVSAQEQLAAFEQLAQKLLTRLRHFLLLVTSEQKRHVHSM